MPPAALSRAELRHRLMGCRRLMLLHYHGFPIEELERRLAGSLALAEAFAHVPFHTQRAEKLRDPRQYWMDFFSSMVNWWPPEYRAPPPQDDPNVDLCDAPFGLSAPMAEALRQAALSVYDQTEAQLAKYRRDT